MFMSIIKRLTVTFFLVSAYCYGNAPALHSANKWSVFADVLIWNAQETCSQWAFSVPSTFVTPPSTLPTGSYDAVLKAVDFDWNVGLRAGVSYTFERDLWDTRLYYTGYRTDGSSHLNAAESQVIQSQFIATDFLLTLPEFSTSFDQGKIHWGILFNMFNGDLGKVFYLGKSLSVRPHLGIQGGWIYQHISAQWSHSHTLVSYSAREILKHRFWGVGPEVGVNTKWNLWKHPQHLLSLYGDLGQVFMWGHWSFNEVAHTTATVTTINTQPDRSMGSLTFQGSSGLIWDGRFHRDQFLFTVKLGYEFQLWIQQLQFFQHFSGILNNDLILQGVTARFLLEF